MDPTDPIHELPRCGGKVSYSKKIGRTVLNRRKGQGFKNLRLYPCPKCNHWHLTHKDRRRD